VLPPEPRQAGFVIAGFVGVLYLIELLNAVLGGTLTQFGIMPRTFSGLDGILFAPLIHVNWGHLIANTLGLLLFGFLAMAVGLGRWLGVTALIWLVSGFGVWLVGGGAYTVGASGVLFGWLTFLLVRGVFNRSLAQILVSVVLFLYWGTTLLGVLPGNPGVSWQGHLFGAIGGVIAAWLVARVDGRDETPPARPALPGSLAM
jgi:membrane associated rhomboid family serine protease